MKEKKKISKYVWVHCNCCDVKRETPQSLFVVRSVLAVVPCVLKRTEKYFWLCLIQKCMLRSETWCCKERALFAQNTTAKTSLSLSKRLFPQDSKQLHQTGKCCFPIGPILFQFVPTWKGGQETELQKRSELSAAIFVQNKAKSTSEII